MAIEGVVVLCLASWRRLAAKASIGTAALSAMLIVVEPNEGVAEVGTDVSPFTNIDRAPAGAIADALTTGPSRPGFASATASGSAFANKDKTNDPRNLGPDHFGFRLLAEDSGQPNAADSNQPNKNDAFNEICRTVERVSVENDLPVEFFTRLIWQESGFKARLTSRKGARGIAQFMPATASERGLRNPFDPLGSLKESASYLRELSITFGNLGLAAAAYNAGPGRISRWLAGKARLSNETTNYVQIVTGHAVTEWASEKPPKWEGAEIPKGVPCEQLNTLITARSEEVDAPDRAMTDQTTGAAPATPKKTNVAPRETSEQTSVAARGETSDQTRAARRETSEQTSVAVRGETSDQTRAARRETSEQTSVAVRGETSDQTRAAPRETSEQTTVAALGETSSQTSEAPKKTPGQTIAALLATLDGKDTEPTPAANSPDSSASVQKTWGVQLAGSWEEGKVLASFERVRRQFPEIIGEHRPLVLKQRTAMGQANRYVLRISEPTRESAEALCDQLRAADGACLVLANP